MTLPTIILVEDDPGHARLIERNLRRRNPNIELILCTDGSQLLDFLYGRHAYAGRTMPDNPLIILDLNMPFLDGFEVLAELSKNPQLDSIPRIIMTTSDNTQDIDACSSYDYLDYIVKPPDYDQLMGLICSVSVPT